MPTHLAIVGMMGSGKSSLAAALAELTGLPVLDSDRMIEVDTGSTSGDFADRHGVDALHALEADIARRALTDDTPAIVTPAASVVDVEDVRRLLAESSFVVWLDIGVDTLRRTLDAPGHRRSITPTEIRALADERRKRFGEVADLRLTERRDPRRMAADVVRAIGQRSGS